MDPSLIRNPEDALVAPGPMGGGGAPAPGGGPSGGAWSLFRQGGGQPAGGGGSGINPMALALLALGNGLQGSGGGGGGNSGMLQMMLAIQQRQQAISYLSRLSPKHGQLVAAGILSPEDAYKDLTNALKPVKVGEGETLVDPTTGRIIFGNKDGTNTVLTKEQSKRANTLRDDFDRRMGDFRTVRDGFAILQPLSDTGAGVSDYALTIAFVKILDPTSVVREGEQAALARNAGRLGETLSQQLQNALKGGGSLPPSVRREIIRAGRAIFAKRRVQGEKLFKGYKRAAEIEGVPWEVVAPGDPDFPDMPKLRIPKAGDLSADAPFKFYRDDIRTDEDRAKVVDLMKRGLAVELPAE